MMGNAACIEAITMLLLYENRQQKQYFIHLHSLLPEPGC